MNKVNIFLNIKHTFVSTPGCQINSPGTSVHLYDPNNSLESISSPSCT